MPQCNNCKCSLDEPPVNLSVHVTETSDNDGRMAGLIRRIILCRGCADRVVSATFFAAGIDENFNCNKR